MTDNDENENLLGEEGQAKPRIIKKLNLEGKDIISSKRCKLMIRWKIIA